MLEKKIRIRIVALAMCLLFSVVLSMGVVAATTSWVEGVVTEEGMPLEGATVTATCNDISSGQDTTDGNGFYRIDLPGCGVGDTVYVEATYNGNTGSGRGILTHDLRTHDYSVTVNLAIVCDAHIPEFTTIAVPVAAILGLVLFFNHRKRRKE